jgi:hypothetical protein
MLIGAESGEKMKQYPHESIRWRFDLSSKLRSQLISQLHTGARASIWYHENFDHDDKWMVKSLITQREHQGKCRNFKEMILFVITAFL